MSQRASRSRRRSRIQEVQEAPVISSPPEVLVEGDPDTGCRICKKDNDHANLLICEKCGSEQHTYCVGLKEVPKDDFYCSNCVAEVAEDEVEKIVNQLPESYTKRFGEIVWAQGGAGYGWWPSCIYDPRLTVGVARELARKHLGKRHLVYFFECYSAPFTVVRGDKIMKWVEGMENKNNEGKVAKATNGKKSKDFDKAFEAACIELSKPIEQRMDFNHPDEEMLREADEAPKAKKRGGRQKSGEGKTQKRKRAQGSKDDDDSAQAGRRSKKKSPKVTEDDNSVPGEQEQTNVLRDFYGKASTSTPDTKNTMKSFHLPNRDEDGPLYCKILVKEMTAFTNIGFVVLTSRWKTRFAEARKVISEELDDDSLSDGWKFYVPKLGPVSVKQEEELRVMPFLSSTSNNVKINSGTCRQPVRLVIVQGNDVLKDQPDSTMIVDGSGLKNIVSEN